MSKDYTPRLKKKYDEQIRAKLKEEFSYTNDMGLHLGMDVPDWPPEDIEALAKKYDDHL